jgi:hypothetical protein
VINMKLTLDNYKIEYTPATYDQLEEYRNEKDTDKRMSLCFELQVQKEDMLPGDYERVIENIQFAMEECYGEEEGL